MNHSAKDEACACPDTAENASPQNSSALPNTIQYIEKLLSMDRITHHNYHVEFVQFYDKIFLFKLQPIELLNFWEGLKNKNTNS